MTTRSLAPIAALIGATLAFAAIVPAHAVTDPKGDADDTAITETVDSVVTPGTLAPRGFSAAADVNNGGLQLTESFTGRLTLSVDGLGITSGSAGALQVEKPADATVLRAFLVASAYSAVEVSALADMRLNGSAVTIRDTATSTGIGFRNYFADVTSIVSSTIDAAPAGVVPITIDEGASSSSLDGTALIVVFEDPAVTLSSIAIYFGTSNSTGDQFSLDFTALTQPQTEDLRMSLGVGFSYGPGQTSQVSVNGAPLADLAGHFDDCDTFVPGVENGSEWTCNNGALISVGGVGDSLDNPVIGEPWSTTGDDELYSLSPFVEVGDSSIEVSTVNPSGDDNIFMAVFYLDKVSLDGSVPIGDPTPVVPEEPIVEEPIVEEPVVEEPVVEEPVVDELADEELASDDSVGPQAAELPSTGAAPWTNIVGLGLLTLALGFGLLLVNRRRAAESLTL